MSKRSAAAVPVAAASPIKKKKAPPLAVDAQCDYPHVVVEPSPTSTLAAPINIRADGKGLVGLSLTKKSSLFRNNWQRLRKPVKRVQMQYGQCEKKFQTIAGQFLLFLVCCIYNTNNAYVYVCVVFLYTVVYSRIDTSFWLLVLFLR